MSAQPSEHAPHIAPLRVYLGVGAALLVLTVITAWVGTIQLGEWNIVVAMTIAALKASLVAFFFMHLYYDNKLYFIVFTAGILFLALFIGFTMIDSMTRGDIDPEVAGRIHPRAAMYDSLAAHPPAEHGEHEGAVTSAPADSNAAPDSASAKIDSVSASESGHQRQE